MKWVSKYLAKINNQLIMTMGMIIIGVLVLFGVVLPQSIQVIVNGRMYQLVEEEQQVFLTVPQLVGGQHNDVYHYVIQEEADLSDQEAYSQQMLHHRMMYPDFFERVQKEAQQMQSGETFTHQYQAYNENIYVSIYKKATNEAVVSYKIDNSSRMVAHEILMSTLVGGIGLFLILMVIFLKWTHRLIKNLKDIQHILDTIEADNLHEDIVTDSYTLEIQEVICSLNRMRKRLDQEERTKRQLIHNMSHDFKTPLAVIKNYAEGMIDGVYPYGTEEETARIIYKQATRLEQKVMGLLYLNRLDYIGSQQRENKQLDLGALVEEVADYMRDSEATYTLKVDAESACFVGDEEQWRVVIENLLENGKRYASQILEVTVREGCIMMYNDGPPIPEQLFETIYLPFEKGKDGVTGLGLAIVKKTVALYGYQIVIENVKEGGVRYTITPRMGRIT
ncbi:MAG: sensor histidine kinase [Cellulosilyticaceae bacterium]